MASATETSKHEHTVIRTTYLIPKPFSTVLSRLESSIVQPGADPRSILTPAALSTREDYEKAARKCIGPHDFMQFFQVKHGAWMPLFGVHEGRQATRVIFGNPLVAITMLRHDVNAGLFVPVEAFLVEKEDNLTEVLQILPSSLIAGANDNAELRNAAEALDAKVAKLWEWVAGEGELPSVPSH
jgi:hypothetical protein